MGRRAVKFDKTCKFQERFAELCNAEEKSLQEFEGTFDATRQTISNWQTGKSTPDIYKLKTIAEYFHVSTDYLLGISDTKSPDVNLKAAVEYTGLSERAVSKLHQKLIEAMDRIMPRFTKKREADRIFAASKLIENRAFSEMVYNLDLFSQMRYIEEIFQLLGIMYSGQGEMLEYVISDLSDEKYDEIAKDLIENLKDETIQEDVKSIYKKVKDGNKRDLSEQFLSYYFSYKEESEVYQFHAVRAFNRYIDNIEKNSKRRAENRLKRSSKKISKYESEV